MRLKVQTKSPLPDTKIWYSFRHENSPENILELKNAICQNIPVLKAHSIASSSIVLLLEEFQLLDESSLDVIRDGDLILVAPVPGYSATRTERTSEKRKREDSTLPNHPLRKARLSTRHRSGSLSSATSSSSSSSSSESSSSDSSDSSSSSSSSPSSSSSSSSSTSPVEPPSKKRLTNLAPLASPSKSSQPLVPPGQGKQQTHSRNLRRRLKKKHVQQSKPVHPPSAPAPPANTSESNNVPLGPGKHRDNISPSSQPNTSSIRTSLNIEGSQNNLNTTVEFPVFEPGAINQGNNHVMMGSLGNKNKRKGFRQSMTGPFPAKIVFADNNASTSSFVTSSPARQEGPPAATLITPSERQERGELPPRMFVTSVDVEEGLHSVMKGKKKQKQSKKVIDTREEFHIAPPDQTMENVQPDSSQSLALDTFDWESAERGWESFVEVSNVDQLALGTIVGWKGLTLNPLTRSPEISLSLAFITCLPGPNNDGQFLVELIPRAKNDSDQEIETELHEEHTWDDIRNANWKIVTGNQLMDSTITT